MDSKIKTTVEITKYRHSGSSEDFESVKNDLEEKGFELIELSAAHSTFHGTYQVVVMEKVEPLTPPQDKK